MNPRFDAYVKTFFWVFLELVRVFVLMAWPFARFAMRLFLLIVMASQIYAWVTGSQSYGLWLFLGGSLLLIFLEALITRFAKANFRNFSG